MSYHLRMKGVFELTSTYNYSGQRGNTPAGPMKFPVVNLQGQQRDAFALSLKNKKRTIVPGEVGRRDVKYINAIYKAMQSGESVVIGK